MGSFFVFDEIPILHASWPLCQFISIQCWWIVHQIAIFSTISARNSVLQLCCCIFISAKKWILIEDSWFVIVCSLKNTIKWSTEEGEKSVSSIKVGMSSESNGKQVNGKGFMRRENVDRHSVSSSRTVQSEKNERPSEHVKFELRAVLSFQSAILAVHSLAVAWYFMVLDNLYTWTQKPTLPQIMYIHLRSFNGLYSTSAFIVSHGVDIYTHKHTENTQTHCTYIIMAGPL